MRGGLDYAGEEGGVFGVEFGALEGAFGYSVGVWLVGVREGGGGRGGGGGSGFAGGLVVGWWKGGLRESRYVRWVGVMRGGGKKGGRRTIVEVS